MDLIADEPSVDHDTSSTIAQQPAIETGQQQALATMETPSGGGPSNSGARSSVTIGAAETITHVADCDVCPSPVVRVSSDRAGVRATPWTKTPQFRQSRRWAKAYSMESPPRPKTAPELMSVKQCPTLDDDPTRASIASLNSDRNPTHKPNDRDPLHEGLCGSGSRRGCRRYTQACLFDHLVPTSNSLKLANSRRRSPVKIIASETRSSPRRVPIPTRVKSKGASRPSQVVQKLQAAMGIEVPDGDLEEENAAVRRSVVSETRRPEMSTHSPDGPVDFWNDPARSKRWSDDCRAILNGDRLLDFNNDWVPKPLTLEPAITVAEAPTNTPLNKTCHPSSGPSLISDRTAAVRLGTNGPQPPIRTSSKGLATTDIDPARKAVYQAITSASGAKLAAETQMAAFQSAAHSTMSQGSHKRVTQLARTPVMSKFNINLKAAKSIDSMAQIEAQLNLPMESNSATLTLHQDSNRQKSRKRTLFNSMPVTLSSPAGNPPERPLPALPIAELDEDGQDTHCESRRTSHQRDSLALDHSREAFSQSHVSPVSTSCDIIIKLDSPQSRAKTHAIAKGLVIDASGESRAKDLITPPSSSPGSIYSQDSSMSLALPGAHAKGHPTERGERIRRLKRKHVAAVMKSKETLREDAYEGDKHVNTEAAYAEPAVDTQHLQGGRMLQPPTRPPPLPPFNVEQVEGYPSKDTTAPIVESDDELPTFPAPPASRPCSRASAAATMHSVQSLTCMSRTTSCSRGARSKIRGGRLPTTQREAKVRRYQTLSRSSIMIVCDTDPSTESFRASARSPITVLRGSLHEQPAPRLEVTREYSGRSAKPRSNPELSKIDGLVNSDMAKSLGAKVSLRSLRSQTSSAKLAIGKHGLGRVSPVSVSSKNGSKQSRRLVVETDSDTDTDGISLSPRKGSSSLPLAKTNPRIKNLGRRKERNATGLSTETQIYVEEMVRVISKCAGRGNKMAKQMLDQPVWLVSGDPNNASLSLALTTQKSSVRQQKLDDGSTPTPTQTAGRPFSGISIITAASTDTDTSANTKKSDHASSLTDPTDQEIMHDLGNSQRGKEQIIRPRASSQTLDKGSEPRTIIRPRTSSKRHKLHTPPPVVGSPRRLRLRNVVEPSQEDLTNVLGLTDKSDSGIDVDGNGNGRVGHGGKGKGLVSARSFTSSTYSNSGVVVGTERFHGVVEGMKHWPHLTSNFGRNDVKIEKVDGTWRLHSRFDFVGDD